MGAPIQEKVIVRDFLIKRLLQIEKEQKEIKALLNEYSITSGDATDFLFHPVEMGEPSTITNVIINTAIKLIQDNEDKRVRTKEVVAHLVKKNIAIDVKNINSYVSAILGREIRKPYSNLRKVRQGVYALRA